MRKINSTDIHVEYLRDTGNNFQWETKNIPRNHSGTSYFSSVAYTTAYAKWLEEKYLELLNNHIDKENLIDELFAELDDTNEYIDALKDEIIANHEHVTERIYKQTHIN